MGHVNPGLLEREDARDTMRRFEERREWEARRIAQTLHDEAGPLLAAVRIALQGLRPHVAPAGRGHLSQAESALVAAQEELRRVATDLRPLVLDHQGLTPALGSLARRVEQRAGIRVETHCAAGPRLQGEIETAMYRIAQEALTNVVKHAGASRVVLDVERTRHAVTLRVRDDGRGFDPRAVEKLCAGMGLEGVRQRVQALEGELAIESRPGGGAQIRASIPVEGPCRRASQTQHVSLWRDVAGPYGSGEEVPHDPLTPREREVLQLIAEGHTTREIAEVLHIRFKTAESHRSHLMTKLDIHVTAGLVRYAIRRGLVRP